MKRMLLLPAGCLMSLAAMAQTNFSATLSGNPINTSGWSYPSSSTASGNIFTLTNSSLFQTGYIYYNTATALSPCAQFSVSFEFRSNNHLFTAADGLAFWYISNPPSGFTTGNGIGLPNNPNGLVLILDTYDNDATSNNPLITLRGMNGTFNYTEGNNTGLLGTEMYNQGFMTNGNWHSCLLTYSNDTVKVAFDGNAPVITAIYPLNISGYFGFSASTGGFASTQAIRNVSITGILPPSPPVAASPIAYCQNDPATALTATGTNLKWYTAATGGTALTSAPVPNTATAPATYTFYVASAGANGCESQRTPVTVNVTTTPPAPTATSPISYCLNEPATALTATGTNLKWYTTATGGTALASAPVPSTSTPGSTTYYVSQSAGTCESSRIPVTVNVTTAPPAPTATSPISYCQNDLATALTATGTNLKWYTTATGGTPLVSTPVPNTSTPGSVAYYVSQTLGNCESPRIPVTVNITATPAAPAATSPISYCQNDPATALTATGTNLKWYTTATGGTPLTSAPVPNTSTPGSVTYYVSQTSGSCESPRTVVQAGTYAFPEAHIRKPAEDLFCTYDSVLLQPENYHPAFSYTWTPAAICLPMAGGETRVVLSQPALVYLTVSDHGCSTRDSLLLQPHTCCAVSLPSAFSPNGDGRNDLFRPISEGQQRILNFKIQNRWGQVIFDGPAGWDGTFAGTPQEIGVYHYYLRYLCTDGTVKELKGEVTLLR